MRRDTVGFQWELAGQGEQHCFELFVVCLRNTEDSQTGENRSSQVGKRTKAETRIFVASVDRR